MLSTIRLAAATAALGAMCASAALAQQRDNQAAPPARPAATKAAAPIDAARPGAPAARQPQAGVQQRTANKPVAGQHGSDPDHFIAAALLIGNEAEVAVGQFAADHSKNREVQKFADMLVKEHSELAQDLAKWAPDASLEIAGTRKAANDTTARTARADSKDDERADAAGGKSFDMLQIHKKIAMRCIDSTKKELGSKEGSDFDMCYVGQQLVLHQQMIDKATVLREYASPDLQASIDKGLDGAKEHLDHAKQLIEKLSGSEKRETRTRASEDSSSK